MFMMVFIAVFGLAIAAIVPLEARRARQIHESIMERLRKMRRHGDAARGR